MIFTLIFLGGRDVHSAVAERRDRLGGSAWGDAGGQAQDDPGPEAVRGGVGGRGADAVVGGDADNVHRVHVVLAQPVRQRDAVVVYALEAAVGGGVGALAEHRLDRLGRQVGVELSAR